MKQDVPEQKTTAPEPKTFWLVRGKESPHRYTHDALLALANTGGVLAGDKIWWTGLKDPVDAATVEWLGLAPPPPATPVEDAQARRSRLIPFVRHRSAVRRQIAAVHLAGWAIVTAARLLDMLALYWAGIALLLITAYAAASAKKSSAPAVGETAGEAVVSSSAIYLIIAGTALVIVLTLILTGRLSFHHD